MSSSTITNYLDPAGVYFIECIPAVRFYIGSTTTSFRRRFNQHKHALRAGRAENSKLQRAWDKYGEAAFVFAPLVNCAPGQAREMEQLSVAGIAEKYGLHKRTVAYRLRTGATGLALVAPLHRGKLSHDLG